MRASKILVLIIFALGCAAGNAAPLAEHPFISVNPKAVESWEGLYTVEECIDCPEVRKSTGQLLKPLSGIAITYDYTSPQTMKPVYKTPFSISFTQYRGENGSLIDSSIDSFGKGLASYKYKETGKKKLVSLGVREHKFYYLRSDEPYGEYDEIEITKDKRTNDIILTRTFIDPDPAFNGPSQYSYKVKLKYKNKFENKDKRCDVLKLNVPSMFITLECREGK